MALQALLSKIKDILYFCSFDKFFIFPLKLKKGSNLAKENIDTGFSKNDINIVSVARLVPQKAIDRLIKIHKRLIDEGIKHQIFVIGDGPEKTRLKTEKSRN